MVLLAIAVLLFAAWFVPKISADRYREPIHRALETAWAARWRSAA